MKNLQYNLFESNPTNELFGVAEINISYRRLIKIENGTIGSSKDIYNFLKLLYDPEIVEYREEFYAVYLDRANVILGYNKIGVGNSVGVVVCPKIIMQGALKLNASSIILTHNHPSGKLVPSQQDEKVTKKLVEAGRLFDTPIIDHIIYSPHGYYSFADEGNLN